MYEICCCFFVAVVQDGESNWLEGVMLMAAYLIISVVFWWEYEANKECKVILNKYIYKPPEQSTERETLNISSSGYRCMEVIAGYLGVQMVFVFLFSVMYENNAKVILINVDIKEN